MALIHHSRGYFAIIDITLIKCTLWNYNAVYEAYMKSEQGSSPEIRNSVILCVCTCVHYILICEWVQVGQYFVCISCAQRILKY